MARHKASYDSVLIEDLDFDASAKIVTKTTKTRRKFKTFDIKDLKWTPKQRKLIDLCTEESSKILFIKGPAGTSKTIISVYSALKMVNEAHVNDIVYVRSAVESSDAKIGHLPGDAEQKLHFYNLPFHDKLSELLDSTNMQSLQKHDIISAYPINFCRGMSWKNKCIIMDEAQNSTFKEIVTLVTRLGNGCKCLVLADPEQTDLTNGKVGGFGKVYKAFDNKESRNQGIHTFEFTDDDIKRSELVKFVVKKLKNIK